MRRRLYLISLGCAKNLVDSEHILGLLSRARYRVVQKIEEADLAVISTCAFIQAAVEESIDTILEVSREKRRGRLKGLFVVGCLVQRYGYKLQRELPEVDGWLGTGEIGRIVEVLEEWENSSTPFFCIGAPGSLSNHDVPRLGTAPYYTSYIKIAEGCSHRCAYCTIPRLRGPLRSRPLDSILREAEELVGRGVREINLVAQDTTSYGHDSDDGIRLENLLEALSRRFKGVAWIRVLYAHPKRISHALLDLLAEGDPICPYLDVPLQHVNRRVLEAMGRASGRETPRRLLERIRERVPRIALRTTLILGFPGETERAFRELYAFVEWAKFDHLGAFVFSPEEGTPAARFDGAVERHVAEERRTAILELQASLLQKKNQGLVGRTLPVLVEGLSEETPFLLTGRTQAMAPEVDGRVLIRKGEAVVGGFVNVHIRKALAYDLIGEIR
ncbi:MAG: 30S ribosomal protein S12 methylthiotransferase RimO [Thermodesulfobacteriota bacterium]